MEYDITFDEDCECYVWWYNGTGMCLAADNRVAAEEEVQDFIDRDIYPEDVILAEGEEEVMYYDDDSDADAAQALASIGWGTDEDYGHYGSDE
jgi:hypothetical protein